MDRRATVLCVALVLSLSTPAFAHGGNMGGFIGPTSKKRGAGSAQSGPADKMGAEGYAGRWEMWWATHRDLLLRERARRAEAKPAVTPSTPGVAPVEDDTRPVPPSLEQELYEADQTARRRKLLTALFLEAMGDGGAEIRAAAAIALAKTGDPRGRTVLESAARNDSIEMVRESATLGVGILGDEASIDFLEALMLRKKTPPRRRSFAAYSLGLVGGERAADALTRFLLGAVGRSEARTRNGHDLIASALVGLGTTGAEEAPEFLMQSIESERFRKQVKPFAIVAVGRTGANQAHGLVLRVMQTEKDDAMRRAAVIALPKLTSEETMDASVEALLAVLEKDKDRVARHYAASSLGDLDTPQTRERLRALLAGKDRRLHPFAAIGLARLGDLASTGAIRERLAKERNETDRASYCLALALLRDREAVPLVRRAFTSTGSSYLRGYSALALGLLEDTESADELVRWIETSTKRGAMHVDTAHALGLLGDERLPGLLAASLPSGATVTVIGRLRMDEMEQPLLRAYRAKIRNPQLDRVPAGTRADPRLPKLVWKYSELERAFAIVGLGMLADRSEVPRLSSLSVGHDYSLRLTPLREVLTIL